MYLRIVIGAAFSTFALSLAGAAAAQQSTAPRFEVSGSVSLSGFQQDGTYSTSFTPPLEFFDRTGGAGQSSSCPTGTRTPAATSRLPG